MKRLLQITVFFALVGLVGCGGQARTNVKGTVTVAGKGALPGGSIRFELISDPSVYGAGQINHEGTYEVTDAPVGECRVIVENEYLKVGSKMAGSGTMPSGGGPGMGKGGPPGGGPGMGRGGPPGGGGMSGPPDAAKKGMGAVQEGPKDAKLDSSMPKNEDAGKTKYVPFNSSFSGSESSLRYTVVKGSNTYNTEVK